MPHHKQFKVTAEMTIQVTTVVRATSEKEASKIAENRPIQKLCCRCTDGDALVEWALHGGLVGEPKILQAKEV